MHKTVILTTILVLALAACSREQQAWRSAQAADTIEAYDRFLERHPDSEFATQARARIAQLGEERDWERASEADTLESYQRFLNQHPNGKWAQEARIRIGNFELANAPIPADASPEEIVLPRMGALPAESSAAGGNRAGTNTVAQPAPAASKPANPPAPPSGRSQSNTATAAAAASETNSTKRVSTAAASSSPSSSELNGFGVQLGAFGNADAAKRQWQQLSSRFPAQLNTLTPRVVPADTAAGRLYRLQAHVGEESRARAICGELARQSQSCIVVLPRRADANR